MAISPAKRSEQKANSNSALQGLQLQTSANHWHICWQSGTKTDTQTLPQYAQQAKAENQFGKHSFAAAAIRNQEHQSLVLSFTRGASLVPRKAQKVCHEHTCSIIDKHGVFGALVTQCNSSSQTFCPKNQRLQVTQSVTLSF